MRTSILHRRFDVVGNLAGERDRQIGLIETALSQRTAAPSGNPGVKEGHPDIRAKLLQERLASILAAAAALPTVNNDPRLRVLAEEANPADCRYGVRAR
ncbi:hypothetical protein LJR016_000966 [Devosia sp. LjRoot16]|uniref:hypothetical protein n=1 Tax=Devosia sp. LjRoot16 TaxID=3342271 RepID=UPI003ED1630B